MSLKTILPVLFFVFVFLMIFFPAIRVYRRTGIWPIKTKNEDALHSFTASLIKVMFTFLFVSIAVYCFGGKYYEWLKPVYLLQTETVQHIGEAIALLSLFWMMLAQYQMGDSWRVGIDDQNKTQLVVKGLYKFSRNPIYIALISGTIGYFLMLPNMLNFATLMCTFFVVSIQIRIEEDFLLQQHGDLFKEYMKKVRRWL